MLLLEDYMKTITALAIVCLAGLVLVPQDANAQRRSGYRVGHVAVRAVAVRTPRRAVYRSYAAYRPVVAYRGWRARYRYRPAYYSYAAYRPYYRAYASYRPYYRSYAAYRPYYRAYASYRPYYSSYASYGYSQVATGPRRSCTVYPSGFRWCWTYF